MSKKPPVIFVERRSGQDRRNEPDRCAGQPYDLYHRKRRRTIDRRAPNRNLAEDISAFYSAQEQLNQIEDHTPTH